MVTFVEDGPDRLVCRASGTLPLLFGLASLALGALLLIFGPQMRLLPGDGIWRLISFFLTSLLGTFFFFLGGFVSSGRTITIDRQARTVTLRASFLGLPMSRVFPFDRIDRVSVRTPGAAGEGRPARAAVHVVELVLRGKAPVRMVVERSEQKANEIANEIGRFAGFRVAERTRADAGEGRPA